MLVINKKVEIDNYDYELLKKIKEDYEHEIYKAKKVYTSPEEMEELETKKFLINELLLKYERN